MASTAPASIPISACDVEVHEHELPGLEDGTLSTKAGGETERTPKDAALHGDSASQQAGHTAVVEKIDVEIHGRELPGLEDGTPCTKASGEAERTLKDAALCEDEASEQAGHVPVVEGADKRSSTFAANTAETQALLQEALLECETAEVFVHRVRNVSDKQVGVLAKPSISGRVTGKLLEPSEAFDVSARCFSPHDGRTYLRLRGPSAGWVCTRSRRDFWKLVLDTVGDTPSDLTPLEPEGCPAVDDSKALQLLTSVDFEGHTVDGERKQLLNDTAAASVKLWWFRVSGDGGLSLLHHPSLAASLPGVKLKVQEEFVADATHVEAKDGRAYLRLRDGRGWVCERSRSDFCKFVVEALHEDSRDPGSDLSRADLSRLGVQPDKVPIASPRKQKRPRPQEVNVERLERERKTIIVEREVAAPSKAPSAEACRSSLTQPARVVFRSDGSLWPKALGHPRPIRTETRRTLHRLAKQFGPQLQDCEADLQDVGAQLKACATSQQRSLLETHADTLRQELAELERQWTSSVEAATVGVPGAPERRGLKRTRRSSAIAPVQVLGEPWHCAVITLQENQYLGPLRSEIKDAEKDMRLMSQAMKEKPKADSNVECSAGEKKWTDAD